MRSTPFYTCCCISAFSPRDHDPHSDDVRISLVMHRHSLILFASRQITCRRWSGIQGLFQSSVCIPSLVVGIFVGTNRINMHASEESSTRKGCNFWYCSYSCCGAADESHGVKERAAPVPGNPLLCFTDGDLWLWFSPFHCVFRTPDLFFASDYAAGSANVFREKKKRRKGCSVCEDRRDDGTADWVNMEKKHGGNKRLSESCPGAVFLPEARDESPFSSLLFSFRTQRKYLSSCCQDSALIYRRRTQENGFSCAN